MIKVISFTCATLISFAAVTTLSAELNFTSITCGGWNKNGKPVSLQLTESSTKPEYFKLVDIKRVIRGAHNSIDQGQSILKPLEGCSNAYMTGLERITTALTDNYDGDLYIECDGEGHAGFLRLKKQSDTTYSATFMSPIGKASLGLDIDETLNLSCTAK